MKDESNIQSTPQTQTYTGGQPQTQGEDLLDMDNLTIAEKNNNNNNNLLSNNDDDYSKKGSNEYVQSVNPLPVNNIKIPYCVNIN